MRKRDRRICRTELLIIIASLVFILLCVKPPGNLRAYLSNAHVAENRFTIGYNTSEVVEEYTEPGITVGDNSFRKVVTIKNTGTVPCYVRAFLAFSDSSIAACSALSYEDSETVPDVFYREADFRTALGSGETTGWTYRADDGFYYYTGALEPDSSTRPLITWVRTDFETQSDVRDYEIIVYEETVQTRDKDGNLFTGETPYFLAWQELDEETRLSAASSQQEKP